MSNNGQKSGGAGNLGPDIAGDKKVKIFEATYDKADKMEASTVTIVFNLEQLSQMSYGADILLGRMDRVREDLAFIILEKQARRAQLGNPGGPMKIVQ